MNTIKSKLPSGQTTIFSVMSALAKEHNAINLSQGFPDYDCPKELLEKVHHYLDQGLNQYAPMPGTPLLREVIAQKMNRQYGCNINGHHHVTITAGATQAIFTFLMAMVGPGDEVIVFEPAYDSYVPGIILAGGIPKPYQLLAPDFSIDWNRVKAMCNEKTKMIIINSPHNPTGSVLSAYDMEALQDITEDTGIWVLSDEVYEHLIYDGRQHESIMRYKGLWERSVAVYSFGKTFHSTGWKIGYCVGPAHLTEEFRKIHQWNVFCVNSFLQHALAEYLASPEHYDYLPGFFQKKRDFLTKLLEESLFRPLKSKGTYFQLVDYSAISSMDDVAFAKFLTIHHGVATIPISVFYSDPVQQKVIRLCFAKNESTLLSATQKLSIIKHV